MTQETSDRDKSADLRHRPAQVSALDELALAEQERLVHELLVHQIELEMQIDELRLTQQELEASRTEYFDFYDLAPVGYFTVSEEGLILEANLTATALLGVERSDLIDQPVSRFIVRDDQGAFYLHHRQAFAAGAKQVGEMRMVKVDGTPFHALLESMVVQDRDGNDQCRTTVTDITTRVWAEQELRKARAELGQLVEERTADLARANATLRVEIAERVRAEQALRLRERVIDASAQGITITDPGQPDNPVIYVNQGFVKMTGHEAAEVLGRNMRFLQGPETDQATIDEIHKAIQAQRAHATRILNYRKDGTSFWNHLAITPVSNDADQLTHFVAIQSDVSEQVCAEQVVRRALEETTRSRRMLLALSQAADAVQRARAADEVYRAVGDGIARLGYHAVILTLTDGRTHLALSHHTFGPALLRAAERLTGLLVHDYRFPLLPGGPLQRILTEGEAAFTEWTAEHLPEVLPRLVRPLAGQLAGLLGLERSIIAPLTAGGATMGLLVVAGTDLTAGDVPAVTAFANQASIALDTAQLLDELMQQSADLQRLSTQLIEAQEAERGRISRELHDELGQALTAMSINLAEIEQEASPEIGPVTRDRLAETMLLTDQALEQVRELALDLRPRLLDDLGLVPTLRWYVNRFVKRTGIKAELQADDWEERLAVDVETALYRAVQEALTNVARHAEASRVRLRLERQASTVSAVIEDDGQGFDAKELVGRKVLDDRTGLLGMRERIALLGGKLRVESRPGRGTRLSIEIPLQGRGGS